jgi:phytoene synthase
VKPGALSERPLGRPQTEQGAAERAALVAHARESIMRGSKSFGAASRLFDPRTRERVWMLYAWCRACDDIADGQEHGGALRPVDDPAARLATIRARTAQAFAAEASGDPAFDALGQVARETGLTPAMAEDVIGGFALDAADWSPRSEADLLRYCFHVAGAVGVMMAVVMGVAPDEEDALTRDTLDRACDLGIAFQLANIARDVREDDAAGRCYLPMEWLAEADVPPGELLKPHYRPMRRVLLARLCALEEAYEASARKGAHRLPFRSRWAVLAAAGIYGAIARKADRQGEAAWDGRVVVRRRAKLAHLAGGLGAAILPPRGADAARPLVRGELAALARKT